MTPAQIGVILEVRLSDESDNVKKLKCRFCEGEFRNIFDLRFHAADAHHVIYVKFVQPYLEETNTKLHSVESIAQDCMKGFREPTYRRTDESVDRF